MSVAGRVNVFFNANVQGFEEGIKKLERSADRVEGIGRSMSLALTAPLLLAGGAAVSAAADFDSLERGLEAVTGSTAEAARQMERLREIAKLPAVDLEQAAKTSIAFQSIGESAEFAERTIKGVANAVALSGGGAEEFSGVMRQLRQVASLGRLMGEEMNVILENAPAMARAIEIAFGSTSSEKIRALGLTTDEFFARLNSALEELPQVSGGARNALDNFWSALRQGAAAIGDTMLPLVTQTAEKLSAWLEHLRTVNPEMIRWGIAIAATTAAIGPLLIGLGSMIRMAAALKVLTGALAGPAGLAVAIGAVAAAMATAGWVEHKLEVAAMADEVDRLSESTRALTSENVLASIFDMSDQLSAAKREMEALKTVGRMNPDAIAPGALDDAQDKVDRLTAGLYLLRQQYLELTAPNGGQPPAPVPIAGIEIGNGIEVAMRAQDAAIERAREYRETVMGVASSLREQNIALTEGAAAAFEYQLAQQGINAAEREALVAMFQRNEALRQQEAEREERSKRHLETLADAQRAHESMVFSVEMWTGAVLDQFAGLFDGTRSVADAGRSMVSMVIGELSRMLAKLIAVKVVSLFLNPASALSGGYGGGVGSIVSMGLASRATGGFVQAGMPHMVGEAGPELFVPRQAGAIVPASASSGGGMTVRLDLSSVPDDSFWSGRQVKDGLVAAFRALEQDGFRVAT